MKRLFILIIAIATVALAMAQNTNDAVVIYKNNVAKKAFRMNQVDSIVLRNSSDVSPDIFESFFENFKVLSSEGVEGQKLGEKDGVWTVCLNAKNADTEKLSFTFDIGGDYKLYANGKEIESGDIVEPGLDTYGLCNPVELSLKQDDEIISTWAVKAYYFDLPTLYINTPDYQAITSKDVWIEGATISLWTTDGKIDTFDDAGGMTQIKGRGNTTWTWAKKPYAIKLDKKCKVLGMPKDKRWNLIANYIDKTRIRNDIAFRLSDMTTSLDWAPRGKYIELILNGKHVGQYYICEHIKVAKDRVNITEMKATDIDDETKTGGYLVEMDFHYDEINKFKSSKLNLPLQFKEPDEEVLQPEQFDYFRDYFNDVEAKITSDSISSTNYRDLIDIDTYIDQWFVYEITSNPCLNTPGSVHMNKDRGGRLKAGPVWDFDYTSYLPSNSQRWHVKNATWFKYLFQDTVFVNRMREKWIEKRDDFKKIFEYVDQIESEIKVSTERDLKIWPLTNNTNGEAGITHDESIARIKTVLLNKLEWMDEQIAGFISYTITASVANDAMGKVYPATRSVKEHSSISLTATPNKGFLFENWTESGEVIGTNATITLDDVTADHHIVANFKIDPDYVPDTANVDNNETDGEGDAKQEIDF